MSNNDDCFFTHLIFFIFCFTSSIILSCKIYYNDRFEIKWEFRVVSCMLSLCYICNSHRLLVLRSILDQDINIVSLLTLGKTLTKLSQTFLLAQLSSQQQKECYPLIVSSPFCMCIITWVLRTPIIVIERGN